MTRICDVIRRAGGPFVLMGIGFLLAFGGLAGDFYQHEIAGFSVELESFFAPVHMLIFTGIAIAALGFLWGLIRIAYVQGPRPNDWAD